MVADHGPLDERFLRVWVVVMPGIVISPNPNRPPRKTCRPRSVGTMITRLAGWWIGPGRRR